MVAIILSGSLGERLVQMETEGVNWVPTSPSHPNQQQATSTSSYKVGTVTIHALSVSFCTIV